MKRKYKQIVSMLIIMTLVISSFSGCGKKKTVSTENENYITRAGWIVILCQQFGLDEPITQEPYFDDIESDSEIFNYVQAACDWGVLTKEGGNFNPNDVATKGFVATTAVLASGADYNQYDVNGNENENIIFLAGMSGIFNDIQYNQEDLKCAVNREEAENAADKAATLYFAQEKEEQFEYTFQDNIKDLRTSSESNVGNSGSGNGFSLISKNEENNYTFPASLASNYNNGDILVLDDERYETGIYKKIISMETNSDGTVTIVTDDPDIDEVFDELNLQAELAPDVSKMQLAEGIELVTNVGSNAYATAMNPNQEAVFLQNATSAKEAYEFAKDSSDKGTLTFKIKYEDGKVDRDIGISYDDFSLNGDIEKELKKKTGSDIFSKDDSVYRKLKERYADGKITHKEYQDVAVNLKDLAKEDIFDYKELYKNKEKGISVTGTISLTNFSIDAGFNKSKTGLHTNLYYDSTLSLDVKGKFEGEIGIVTIPFAGPAGVVCEIEVALTFSAEGGVTFKIGTSNACSVEYALFTGKKKTSQTRITEASVSVSGEISSGPKFDLSIGIGNLQLIDVGIEGDFVLSGELKLARIYEYSVDEANNEFIVDSIRQLTQDASLKFEVNLSVGYKKKTLANKLGLKGKWTVWDKEIWTLPEDKKLLGEWKHDQFRMEIIVEPQSSSVAETANVVLDLDTYYANVVTGESKVLTVSAYPTGYSKKDIKWTSSDTSIATVNSSGTVTAVKEGTVTITAATSDGKYESKCTITVTDDYVYKK